MPPRPRNAVLSATDAASRAQGPAVSGSTPAPQSDATSVCHCGCGEEIRPGRRFLPGHDLRLLNKLAKDVGGVLSLKAIVERHLRGAP